MFDVNIIDVNIIDINTIIASIGLVLATVSFITGLQVVNRDKVAAVMMASMHRINGYLVCLIYIVIAALSLGSQGGVRPWSIVGWSVGMGLIIIKIMVVRNQRFYKYSSRLGLLLFVSWLVIMYRHIVT